MALVSQRRDRLVLRARGLLVWDLRGLALGFAGLSLLSTMTVPATAACVAASVAFVVLTLRPRLVLEGELLTLIKPTGSYQVAVVRIDEVKVAPSRYLWYPTYVLSLTLRNGDSVEFSWISWVRWNAYLAYGDVEPSVPARFARVASRVALGISGSSRGDSGA